MIMRGFVFTWDSDEKSTRLVPREVQMLFEASYEMMKAGQLGTSLITNACRPIYWERIPIGVE